MLRFEPGKYYKHASGCVMATLQFAKTTMWGRTLVAEEAGRCGHSLFCVGTDSDDYAVGWEEITEEEWMGNFEINS